VDRRTALLEAAEQVLSERGLSATVADITTQAGVAKGTFYLYFSSKEDVIRAVQSHLYDDYLATAAKATARMQEVGWWRAVEEFIAGLVDLDIAHRDWHRLVGQGWSEPGPITESSQEMQLIAIIEAAIRLGMETGECHTDDPELTATMLYRATQGTCSQLCQRDDPIDRERVIAALTDLVRKVLAPR
jgi:AcrR family transcriptional regulator